MNGAATLFAWPLFFCPKAPAPSKNGRQSIRLCGTTQNHHVGVRMRKPTLALVMGALLLLGSACSDSTGPVDPRDLTFASALGVDLATMTRSSTGLYYKDLTVGTGAQANVGARLTVDYTGWLHNGTQFDSSAGKAPYPITSLGSGQVIAGWDEGLMGM